MTLKEKVRSAVLNLRGEFSIVLLHDTCGGSLSAVRSYANELVAEGLLRVVKKGHGKTGPAIYRRIRAGLMWRIIERLKGILMGRREKKEVKPHTKCVLDWNENRTALECSFDEKHRKRPGANRTGVLLMLLEAKMLTGKAEFEAIGIRNKQAAEAAAEASAPTPGAA